MFLRLLLLCNNDVDDGYDVALKAESGDGLLLMNIYACDQVLISSGIVNEDGHVWPCVVWYQLSELYHG